MTVENIEFAGETSYMAENLVAEHRPNCQPTHGNFCDCPRRKVREEEWAWRFNASVNGEHAACIVGAPGPRDGADEDERDLALACARMAFDDLAASRPTLPDPRPNPLYWPPKRRP